MILVIGEHRGGRLHRASWEALAAAQEFAGALPVEALLAGNGLSAAAAELGQGAVATVHAVEHAALATYTPDGRPRGTRKLRVGRQRHSTRPVR